MRRRILNAEQGLWRLRDTGRPFETHHSTTASRTILSYSINPVVWYVYYHLLQDFLDVVRTQENSERLPLYIRANVIFPGTVISHTLVRHTIYSLFY